MNIKLEDVQETALIPLAVRANETMRKNNRITDEKAVEIIKALGVDTAKYDKFISHEGVVARTILIDGNVKALIKKFGDCVCVNIGCGLDNRFSRVDNGQIKWYNADLPSSIDVRRKVYSETECERMIGGNVLETKWLDSIPKDKKTIIIAEGLLMYFSKEQVQSLLSMLTSSFESGFLVAELMHPKMTNAKHHDTVGKTGATFGFGTESGHDLEELNPAIKLIKEDSLNVIMRKYTLRGKLFNTFFKNLNNRIAVFKW